MDGLAPSQPLPGLGNALHVTCPHCGALPRAPCTTPAGDPLRLTACHPARAERAGAPPPRVNRQALTSATYRTPPGGPVSETAAPEAPPAAQPSPEAAVSQDVEVLPRAALAACDVPLDLDQRIRLADAYSRANVLPKHLRGQPGNVLAICFAAHALQIPLWPATQEMHCIDGKVGISANLMRGLWLRAGHKFRVTERTAEQATVEVTRIGDDPYSVTWTIQDAIDAGLCWRDEKGTIRARPADKPNKALPWELYTKAMLVARATSSALREVGADVLMGFGYTPDELSGGDVYFEGAGAVHVTTSVQETPEAAADRAAKAQASYDACVEEIEAAPNDDALKALWRRYADAGVIRLDVIGREGTLEQRILAVRERRAADAEEAREAAAQAAADLHAAGMASRAEEGAPEAEDPPGCPACGGLGAQGGCTECGLLVSTVTNR